MVKPKDPVWNLFVKNRDNSVSCKHCSLKYTFGNACKMRKHIAKCMKCPEDDKNKYLKNHKVVLNSNGSTSTSTANLKEQVYLVLYWSN